jgi:hypothetical protein
MKRWLLLAILASGCMTPSQQQQVKKLDAEIESARTELRELATVQKVVDQHREAVKMLTEQVDALRTEVTELEVAGASKGKSRVFLR